MDLSEPKQPGTSPADHERGPSDAAVRLSGSSARIGCGWTGARVRRIRGCAPRAIARLRQIGVDPGQLHRRACGKHWPIGRPMN